MGGVFDPVIPVVSYAYYERTKALDELFRIVSRAFGEGGVDVRLVLPPPTLDLELAEGIVKYVYRRKSMLGDIVFLFGAWRLKYITCGDFMVKDEIDDARRDWMPSSLMKLFKELKARIGRDVVSELREWVERYEHVFYETEATALLVKHATRQAKLFEIIKKFTPVPLRMKPDGIDKVRRRVEEWLGEAERGLARVEWSELPQAEPPDIGHVELESIAEALRESYGEKNVSIHEALKVPIGVYFYYSKVYGRDLYLCITLEPPPPVYPAKIRMYTCLHYMKYYGDILDMLATLRDKLERKEIKYSTLFRTFAWELLPQEATQRAALARGALDSLNEVTRGYLAPSLKETLRKLFRNMRKELEKVERKAGTVLKPSEASRALKHALLLLM